MNRQERIANGVAFLDAHRGPEWPSFINLDGLCMADTESCVLGQGMSWDMGIKILYREIEEGKLAATDATPYETQFGFEYNMDAGEHYGTLEAEWKRTIKRLREERGL